MGYSSWARGHRHRQVGPRQADRSNPSVVDRNPTCPSRSHQPYLHLPHLPAAQAVLMEKEMEMEIDVRMGVAR